MSSARRLAPSPTLRSREGGGKCAGPRFDVGIFIAIMALGFVVGILGHLSRTPALIITGIVLVFLGTVVLPLLLVGGGT